MNYLKLFIVIGTAAAIFSAPASSETWRQKHPRRAEVLRRDNRQAHRNEWAERHGKITENQERHLNREDRRIRHQEQRDARMHGGHITRGEQHRLNREENHVNRERRRDERRDH